MYIDNLACHIYIYISYWLQIFSPTSNEGEFLYLPLQDPGLHIRGTHCGTFTWFQELGGSCPERHQGYQGGQTTKQPTNQTNKQTNNQPNNQTTKQPNNQPNKQTNKQKLQDLHNNDKVILMPRTVAQFNHLWELCCFNPVTRPCFK